MRYQYGAPITVVPPGGPPVKAQVGVMTEEGPVIHVPSFEMEAPAETLRQDGWQIPDIDREASGVNSYAVEAAKIVDALLNADELKIAKRGGPPEHAVGREIPRRQQKPPYCKNCGSYAHTTENCPTGGLPIS